MHLPHILQSGFDEYFSVKYFPNTKVIFIMDEFDQALEFHDKEDFLMSLRLTSSGRRTGGALHTFVGVGTYRMIALVAEGRVC